MRIIIQLTNYPRNTLLKSSKLNTVHLEITIKKIITYHVLIQKNFEYYCCYYQSHCGVYLKFVFFLYHMVKELTKSGHYSYESPLGVYWHFPDQKRHGLIYLPASEQLISSGSSLNLLDLVSF